MNDLVKFAPPWTLPFFHRRSLADPFNRIQRTVSQEKNLPMEKTCPESRC